MASRKKGISAGPTCPAQSLASTRKYHGWSREGYDRYNVLYQRVKINCRDLGASFDFHVKIYEEHQDQGSLGDRSKAEDYVLPLTMNDFDEEEDDHDDDSEGPRKLTSAEEESIRREATQASSDASEFS